MKPKQDIMRTNAILEPTCNPNNEFQNIHGGLYKTI